MSALFSVSRLARVTAATVAGVLIAGSVVLTGGAAYASVDEGGMTFTLDEGTQTAAVTGYDRVNTDVFIPDSVLVDGSTSYAVTSVGDFVFAGAGLESVRIGANVTEIGYATFAANSLQTLVLPESMRTIGDWAFDENLLSTIVFPTSAVDIGYSVFNGNSMTEVVVPSWMTIIPDSLFSWNALTSVTIPDTVTEIGGHAFAANQLTSVDVPGSVVRIGDDAFANNLLTSVTLNEGLVFINGTAFKINNLTSVSIPASVDVLGDGAFQENPNLTTVEFDGDGNFDYIANAYDEMPSLGTADGLTVRYLARFDGDGGFSSPEWRGYTSAMDAVVSFEPNGHGVADTQRIASGTVAVVPTVPTAAGWNFGGWFSDSALTVAFDFSAAVTADVTAYAQWTEAVAATPSLALDLGLAVGDPVAGRTVTVSGAGLKPESAYDLVVRSTPVTMAFGSASVSGTFAATGVIPAGLGAGAHTVTLSGTAPDGTAMTRVAYFTVDAAGVVTYLSYTEAQAVLAATGVEVAPLGFAALLLLLAGIAIVLGRRRSVA